MIEAKIKNKVSGSNKSEGLFILRKNKIGCNNLFENNISGEDRAPKNGIMAPMLTISVKDEIIIKSNNRIKCFCRDGLI